jgi:hypothetical protein
VKGVLLIRLPPPPLGAGEVLTDSGAAAMPAPSMSTPSAAVENPRGAFVTLCGLLLCHANY